jgi:hypothetical protein
MSITTIRKGGDTMADNMLGIMITKNANLEHISGIVKAAHTAGHPVQIFMTDEGVKFSQDPKFLELLKVGGVEISVCDHSCERIGVHGKTDGISYGSQYNNATMLHDSARILVF